MIGDIVDKYQIVKKLGEGGMATVYQGRHTSLSRDVAIKILHPSLASTERNRQRFAREARAIEQLNHPNIVQILDYSGQEGDSCYIITELIEGLTLRQLMEEQEQIPCEIIALIGIELCEALGYAHRLGLIHRDIKPENIMIRTDGAVKLMDFGIARFAEENQLTLTGTLVGSPAYMSPEQALEQPIDHRSDLFSLGTVLFQLATRELPFHGSNPSVILKNIIDNKRSHPQAINPQLSSALSNTIEGLLQLDPAKRFQTAEEIQESLRKVFDEDQIDITDQSFSLVYWLSSPSSYQQRLHKHIIPVLLHTGKELLSKGKHLEAQEYLNRLLSLDPQNETVFTLLQEMHTAIDQPIEKEEETRWWPFVIPIVLSLVVFWNVQKRQAEPVIEKENISQRTDSPTEPTTDSVKINTQKKVIEAPNLPKEDSISVEVKKEQVKAKLTQSKPKMVASTPKISAIKQQKEQPEMVKEEKVEPPKPVKKGQLTVSIPSAWADIWIDDQKMGRTGQIEPIEVIPGEHILRLENQFSLPHQETFTIESGETKHIEVRDLQRKPATLVFSSQHDDQCLLFLDKEKQGNLAELKHKLSIVEPNLPHEIALDCGDEVIRSETSQLSPGSTVPIEFK